VGSAASASKLLKSPTLDKPHLVLIAPKEVEDFVAEASLCRQEWPECRIVALYDCLDPDETERMLCSSANGCVHTSVSENGLLRFLDLVLKEENEVVLLLRPRRDAEPKQETFKSIADAPGGGGDQTIRAPLSHPINGTLIDSSTAPSIAPDHPGKNQKAKLSERELKVLEGIVRGLQNKMIAREYGIAEATVKVHMKAILRKIQVANRTQAAVWAMENNVTQVEKL
jgi:two-component system nitrate/nitrite response regulator NarL